MLFVYHILCSVYLLFLLLTFLFFLLLFRFQKFVLRLINLTIVISPFYIKVEEMHTPHYTTLKCTHFFFDFTKMEFYILSSCANDSSAISSSTFVFACTLLPLLLNSDTNDLTASFLKPFNDSVILSSVFSSPSTNSSSAS